MANTPVAYIDHPDDGHPRIVRLMDVGELPQGAKLYAEGLDVDMLNLDNTNLNLLEKVMLKHMIKKLLIQGPHKQHLVALFKEVHKAARKEFMEDNDPTLNAFIQECLDEAIYPQNIAV